MHRYRTSLVLGGVVLVGLAYIWFVDREAQTTDQATERKDNVFARFEEDDVDRVSLSGAGRDLLLEKKDGHWRMKRPVDTAADDGAVGSLLSSIGFLTKERTVSGADARRQKSIGLAHPRLRGEIRQKGRTTRFSVGAEDAAGRSVYVAVDDADEVFVVGKDFYESLSKDPSEFRDKKVLALRMSDVQHLRITGGDATIEVSRQGSGFRLESPTKGLASQAKVEDVLRGLENLRAERFVADGARELARFGLEPAWRTISARPEHGDSVEVRVGAPCEGHADERHVTRVGSGTVVCAKADLWTTLAAAAETFREKRVSTVRADDVRKIALAGGATRVEIERDGEHWRLVRPEAGPADSDAVEHFIEDLRRSEASAFEPAADLAKKGLEPARTTVILSLEGDLGEERIAIGTKDGTDVWARRGDEASVLRVPASVLDVVRPSSIRFRPRQLVNDDSLDAKTLRIEAAPPGVSQELEKEEGVWKVGSPIQTRADSLSTRDLLRRIAELTVERFDAERPEPRHGLAAPRLTIYARFEREGGEDAGPSESDDDAGPSNAPPRPRGRVREYTILFGAKTDGGYFAQLRGKDAVFVLPDAFFDDASRPLCDRNSFQIDEGSAKRIRLERAGKAPLSLVREGEGWRREGGGSVDAAKVRDLFDKLGGARALRAVGYGAAAMAEGLAAPRARLTIHRDDPPEGEPNEVVIVVGAKVGEGADEGAFARRTDVASTLVLPKDVADTILGLDL